MTEDRFRREYPYRGRDDVRYTPAENPFSRAPTHQGPPPIPASNPDHDERRPPGDLPAVPSSTASSLQPPQPTGHLLPPLADPRDQPSSFGSGNPPRPYSSSFTQQQRPDHTYGQPPPPPASANGYPLPAHYLPPLRNARADPSHPPPSAPSYPGHPVPPSGGREDYPYGAQQQQQQQNHRRSQPSYDSPSLPYFYAPPPPPPNGYRGYAHPPHPEYPRDYQPAPPPPPGYESHPDYLIGGQPGGVGPPQPAPRQRTSIACRYCRKRKIRCSGFSNGGSCINCNRMHQECVFQPVSSANTTAFVPITAVQGGIPPGTQLYGSYGQPIGQAPAQPIQAQASAPVPQPQQAYYQTRQPQMPVQAFYHPQTTPTGIPSPTEPHSPYDEIRPGDRLSIALSRRRRRDSADEGDDQRLPPPRRRSAEEDPRRRTPLSSNSSPGLYNHQDPPSRDEAWSASYPSPQQLQAATPSQPAASAASSTSNVGPIQTTTLPTTTGTATTAMTISPTTSHSSGASPPPHGNQGNSSSIMSLSNLMERPASSAADIDRTMLGRLDGWRRQQ